MPFPDEISQLIDWVNQPTPAVVTDTHTLYFWLTATVDGVENSFYGQLFYGPQGSKAGTARFARLVGGGFQHYPLAWLATQLPPGAITALENMGSWVSVAINLGADGDGFLEFHGWQPGTSDDHGVISTVDFAIASVQDANQFGALLFLDNGWSLILSPSTVAPGLAT